MSRWQISRNIRALFLLRPPKLHYGQWLNLLGCALMAFALGMLYGFMLANSGKPISINPNPNVLHGIRK